MESAETITCLEDSERSSTRSKCDVSTRRQDMVPADPVSQVLDRSDDFLTDLNNARSSPKPLSTHLGLPDFDYSIGSFSLDQALAPLPSVAVTPRSSSASPKISAAVTIDQGPLLDPHKDRTHTRVVSRDANSQAGEPVAVDRARRVSVGAAPALSSHFQPVRRSPRQTMPTQRTLNVASDRRNHDHANLRHDPWTTASQSSNLSTTTRRDQDVPRSLRPSTTAGRLVAVSSVSRSNADRDNTQRSSAIARPVTRGGEQNVLGSVNSSALEEDRPVKRSRVQRIISRDIHRPQAKRIGWKVELPCCQSARPPRRAIGDATRFDRAMRHISKCPRLDQGARETCREALRQLCDQWGRESDSGTRAAFVIKEMPPGHPWKRPMTIRSWQPLADGALSRSVHDLPRAAESERRSAEPLNDPVQDTRTDSDLPMGRSESAEAMNEAPDVLHDPQRVDSRPGALHDPAQAARQSTGDEQTAESPPVVHDHDLNDNGFAYAPEIDPSTYAIGAVGAWTSPSCADDSWLLPNHYLGGDTH